MFTCIYVIHNKYQKPANSIFKLLDGTMLNVAGKHRKLRS